MKSNLNQENFRMSGKMNKNSLKTETFSSRAKQNFKMNEKSKTIKKKPRHEIMTPKTPNDHALVKSWNNTITAKKVNYSI